jgi:hypothetical protein
MMMRLGFFGMYQVAALLAAVGVRRLVLALIARSSQTGAGGPWSRR